MTHEPDIERLELAYANLEDRPDYQIQELKTLASQGSSMSPMYLGWIYQTGKLVKQDNSEAEHWFLLSLERGCSLAAYYLGCLYLKSNRGSEAIEVFERGITLGSLPSKYRLAIAILDGDVEGLDRLKAKKLLSEASQSGHVFAMRRMASICFNNKDLIISGKLLGIFLWCKAIILSVFYGAKNFNDERLLY